MQLMSTEPFVDTTPGDLTHSLVRDPLPALATKRVGPLELRVLGASHQVTNGHWVETVACTQGQAEKLPKAIQTSGYTFASQVTRHDREALTQRVRQVQTATAQHPGGIVVAFAGDPLALTAIQAHADKNMTQWETWHVYPNTGEVVHTHSTLATIDTKNAQENA